MKAKAIFSVLILIALPALILMLNPSIFDQLESKADLLERIAMLEKSLELSNQQIQDFRQKEAEYLQQISELQTANQQLENKHKRNLEELFK